MISFQGVTHLVSPNPEDFSKLKERLKNEGIHPINYKFKNATRLFQNEDRFTHEFLITGADIEPMNSGLYGLTKLVKNVSNKIDISNLNEAFDKIKNLIARDSLNRRITFQNTSIRKKG